MNKMKIFLSVSMTPWEGDGSGRSKFVENFRQYYTNRVVDGTDRVVEFVTCDKPIVSGKSPLNHVQKSVKSCSGVVAIGLIDQCVQMVASGWGVNTIFSCNTPWNEIEIAMAVALGIPYCCLAESELIDRKCIFNRDYGANAAVLEIDEQGSLNDRALIFVDEFLSLCASKSK